MDGGDHGVYDRLPVGQVAFDGRVCVGELAGELEDLGQGLIAGGGPPRQLLEELAQADAWNPLHSLAESKPSAQYASTSRR
jgi:hypothetical protein